ncbi:MAG: hypothetical protein P8J20_02840 [Novosphingobium sp.]|nr:hypothetical protein [Novosphingobium sp.]
MIANRRRIGKSLAVALLFSTSLTTATAAQARSVYTPEMHNQQLFQAYANSKFTYCDAKMIAALWGQDIYQGKLRIGNKIGGAENVIENELNQSRQRGNSCQFNETEFTYQDAQNLSAAWGGQLSIEAAKLKIAAFVTAGQSAAIRQQMNQGGGNRANSDDAHQQYLFNAYANSKFTYCDAKMIGALWGQDVTEGKLRIGQKIGGGEYIIEDELNDSRQRGNSCRFDETGFTYQDAQRLSAAWGNQLSIESAKVKIAAFVTAGRTAEIRAQYN